MLYGSTATRCHVHLADNLVGGLEAWFGASRERENALRLQIQPLGHLVTDRTQRGVVHDREAPSESSRGAMKVGP